MKYRIQFTKTGSAAFLGHLELMNVLRRALRRAGLRLRYSEGFHPHARISFGKALAVGVESECEFCDVELLESVDKSEIERRLVLPEGIGIVCVKEIGKDTPSIESSIAAARYEMHLPLCKGETEGVDLPSLTLPYKGRELIAAAISRFNSSTSVPFLRRRGDKTASIDLKHYITELVVDGEGVIGMTLNERIPMIRVSEVLTGIFGISESDFNKLKIRKISALSAPLR